MNAVNTNAMAGTTTYGSRNIFDSAKLAHDLKGPLNSIRGLLVIAASEVEDGQALRYFRIIEKYENFLCAKINKALNRIKGIDYAANDYEASRLSSRTSSFPVVDDWKSGILFSKRNQEDVAVREHPFSSFSIATLLNFFQNQKKSLHKRLSSSFASPYEELTKLSQELTGPLRSVKQYLEEAKEEVKDKEAKNYLELIERCHQQLDSRVKKTMQTLQDGSERQKMEQIDFQSIIDEIILSLKHMEGFSEVEINISIDDEGVFFSDSDAIYSILQNLLENAIKYRKHDLSRHLVNVKVVGFAQGVHIEVSDNGIGIREELFSEIFKFKVRDDNTPEDGHGIGLALVKQQTERLKGKITLDSKVGGGTVFTLQIPNMHFN